MSALARMSAGAHKQIKIKKGDTVILSSKFIPGNERSIAKIVNNLYKRDNVAMGIVFVIVLVGVALHYSLRSMAEEEDKELLEMEVKIPEEGNEHGKK